MDKEMDKKMSKKMIITNADDPIYYKILTKSLLDKSKMKQIITSTTLHSFMTIVFMYLMSQIQ